MTPPGWDDIAAEALSAVAAADRRRRPRDLDSGRAATAMSRTGEPMLSFASNDYLGLSQHPGVKAAAAAALEHYGAGSGSARLIVGSRPVHTRLEARLAAWRGAEAALLFTTGYAANLGVMAAVGRWASVICSDELNHASIIDGCRLARAPTRVFGHRDTAAVDEILRGSQRRGLVVSDSVFSMDGDLAPVAELSRICAAHGALLILDDAHLVLDHPEALHPECRTLRVGTLSKAVGALGGYVCGPVAYVDLLVNTARSFIFTTAATPAAAAAAHAAIDIIDSPEGAELKGRLRANIDRLRPGHPSPIVPIVVGREDAALAASEALARQGILVPAIRPPTVPEGTSRLRVTVSAAHTTAELDRLVEALQSVEVLESPTAVAEHPGRHKRPSRGRTEGTAAHLAPQPSGVGRAAGAPKEPCRPLLPPDAAVAAETVVFVTGTATEVGKTWATASLAGLLRRQGRTVRARKPLQSYDPDEASPTDAEVLAAATGRPSREICPPEHSYPVPLAPPMAAARLGGRCPRLDELLGACHFADGTDVGFVEGAGGLFSPLAADGSNLDLIERLDPDAVVVVAEAGLGAIHAVLACVLPLAARRPLVFLNRFDPAIEVHRLNRQWLRDGGWAVDTRIEDLADRLQSPNR